MMNTKRRGNVPPQNDSEERESLMSGGGIEMTSKRTPTRSTLRSGNTSPHRREKRKTSGVMSKDDEERVSLIGGGGGGGGRRPQGGRRPLRIADTRRRTVFDMFSVPKFNMNTIMRYIGLMLASATVSFMLFHRQPRNVHWGRYNKILEPDVGRGTRCFVSVDRFQHTIS